MLNLCSSVYMAVSTDVLRGTAGVPGGPYGLLLPRSADFTALFDVAKARYASSIDRIAIVLDGVVQSAPVVQSVPLGKNFVINGLDEPGETKKLANALMNPLENPLIVEEERSGMCACETAEAPADGGCAARRAYLAARLATCRFLCAHRRYRYSSYTPIVTLPFLSALLDLLYRR
jgi:hypothetical protein